MLCVLMIVAAVRLPGSVSMACRGLCIRDRAACLICHGNGGVFMCGKCAETQSKRYVFWETQKAKRLSGIDNTAEELCS